MDPALHARREQAGGSRTPSLTCRRPLPDNRATPAGKTNKSHVPAVGIIASALSCSSPPGVNAVAPVEAFTDISSVATLGPIWS